MHQQHELYQKNDKHQTVITRKLQLFGHTSYVWWEEIKDMIFGTMDRNNKRGRLQKNG